MSHGILSMEEEAAEIADVAPEAPTPARKVNWRGFIDRDLPLPGELIPNLHGYRRMSHEEYLKFPAINAALLKCRTAAEMFAQLNKEHKDTDATTNGTLVHMVTLEPETSWAERFALADIPINPTTGNPYGEETKKGKAAWEQARKDHPGKIIATVETMKGYLDECRVLQFALKANPDAMSELEDAEYEVTGILWHPVWNCWVKWRPDILPRHCRYMPDLKTSSRHAADFVKDMWQFGYFTQAVWYAHCHELLTIKLNLPVTKAPYIVLAKSDESRIPRPPMCRVMDLPLDPALSKGVKFAMASLGLPQGLSRVDVFLNCLNEFIAAGEPENTPENFLAIRKIWPAFEQEAGERGRWIIED